MSKNNIIVAIYPNQIGMGYVICEHPNDIIHYGIGKVKRLSPDNYVKRLIKFIKQYRPDVVILKQVNPRTSKRIALVIKKIEEEALERGISVYHYSRDDMQKVFSTYGDTHKYGISRTLAQWYPDLKRFIAPFRTFMVPEDYHMGIFDSFALMYTHCSLIGITEKPYEN